MSHAINGSLDLFDVGQIPTSSATYSSLPSSPNASRTGNVPPLAPLPLTTVSQVRPSPALPTPPHTPTLPLKKFSYWSLLLPLYVPGFFVFAAEAAWVVAMPLYMREMRYRDDALGIAVAAASVMAIFTNLLAGYFITRFGCKMVQLGAMLAYAASGVILYLSMHFTLLIAGCLVKGIGWSLYRTSRSALMTVYIPPTHRGRSVGILGGCNRVSAVIGPLMTGFVAQHMGTSLSFLVITVCTVPSIIALSFTTMNYTEGEDPHAVEGSASARGSARTFNHPDAGSEPLLAPEETDVEDPVASPPITPNTNATSPSTEFPAHQHPKGYHLLHVLWRVLVAHRKDFLFIGMFCLFFTVLRSGRDLILPLKAHDEGLKKDMVGSVVSACNAADSVSFPIAGILMDRYGRKFSGIPASLVLSIGFILIPFVKLGWTLFGAAVVLGLGNGLSSGIVMTIGTDLAPARHRGEFLGLFLILEDGGRLVAPLLLGFLSEQINLGAAGHAFAIIGVGCAVWMWLACPETLRKEQTHK